MAKMVDVRAVQAVLYGVYKSLHRISGSSAGAVMRQAAPDILKGLVTFGVDVGQVNSIETLQSALADTMVAAGCCDEMKFELKGNRLKANIKNCSFFELTQELGKEGIPPFGCPFAALTIALADSSLKKRGRVVRLEPTPGGVPGDTELEVELH